MRLRNLFITASSSIADHRLRRRAEILSYLILGNLGVLLIVIVFVGVYAPYKVPSLLQAIALNLFAYGLSRSAYFRFGAALVIVQNLISIPITVLTDPNAQIVAVTPVWLALVTLISSLVLPMRLTLLTVLAMTFSYVVMFVGIPADLRAMLFSHYLFCISSSALAVLGTYHLQRSDDLLELERAKLLQVSKLSALGEIAAGIAHEINTPLASIMLNAEMLERDLNNSGSEIIATKTKGRVHSIVEISDRISTIIHGLKGFARDASTDLAQTFSLEEWIQTAVELCGQKFKNHGVDLQIEAGDMHHLVDGQKIQLAQTLLNLLNNSYDAIQDLEEKWIKIDARVRGDQINLRIRDSGPGIRPEHVEKLFLPFFTTKDIGKGTGLGLSISLGIIKSHGGDLFYDDRAQHTTFVIRLPQSKGTL